jgi:hypothetical protein
VKHETIVVNPAAIEEDFFPEGLVFLQGCSQNRTAFKVRAASLFYNGGKLVHMAPDKAI